jgi:DNA polymerase I
MVDRQRLASSPGLGRGVARVDRTLVVSATNLLARGFLVIPVDRRAPGGDPVNGLFAVARAVQRAVAFKVPARAVAVVAPAAPAWPALLAAQLPALPELLRALGLVVVTAPDEAHVVASYARAALADGGDVIVAGIDKRYAQLVGDRLWWYDANKDVRYTPEIVAKRFLVPPAQVAEWLALVGDEDALPGVAGIGAKGATGLLEQHGTIEAALAAVAGITGRTGNALRAAGPEAIRAEVARASLDGARPLPVPLAELVFTPAPPAERNALFDRLGFVELLVADGGAVRARICEAPDDLAAELARYGAGPVALHAVIDGAAGEEGGDEVVVGVALAPGAGDPSYAPLTPATAAVLGTWLADPAIAKLVHGAEGVTVALGHAGLPIAGIAGDAAAASHLTQPSNWAPHDLAIAAKHVLGRALPVEDVARGVGRQRKAWAALPVERVADFAAQHAVAVGAVWHALAPALDRELLVEYRALSEVLVRMERTGIAVDPGELDRAEHDFAGFEAALLAEIEALAGKSFNVNSSKQLGAVLFEDLKLPVVSHTKTGWSTSIEALERIEHAHPIVPLVLRWRLLRRLRDSWIIALRRCVGADGRVHSRFHPARSFSGRLVNTNPDLGRVPGRTPEMARIRRAFVARPGWALMSIDYNQLGLHVLAHLTRDPALVEPLRERRDMHALTAAAVLDRPLTELTPDERQLGKVVNFATFAGQGASALALQLRVTAAEASALIEKFDAHYAQVRAFQDEQSRLAHERGYIVTLAGRRWPIGGLESLDPHDRSYAERLARRATHEGSVSDVSRRGLLDADRALRGAGLAAQPVAQILDEVLFEVPIDEVPAAARAAGRAMRDAFAPLEVPLVVGIEAGPNWADLAPLAVEW